MPVVKLFGNDQAAWIKTMSIWCAIALVLLVICFVRCKEPSISRPRSEGQPRFPVSPRLKRCLATRISGQRSFCGLSPAFLTTIIGTDLPYYCKYVLGNDEW